MPEYGNAIGPNELREEALQAQDVMWSDSVKKPSAAALPWQADVDGTDGGGARLDGPEEQEGRWTFCCTGVYE
jgi:hypothetical protein